MYTLRWRPALPALVLLGAVVVPTIVLAQAGLYLTPSFSITEAYNNNIFYTSSDRKADFLTRFSPGVLAGYESVPLTLLGGYTFDTEMFARLAELNTATARQKATISFRYLPTRLLNLSAKGEYAETQTPGELNVLSGLPAGRVRAQRFLLDPSIAYRFDPLTTGTLGYTFTRDEVRSAVTTDTHTVKAALNRQITSRDAGEFEYTSNSFVFGVGGTTKAHVFTLGWTRELTPLLSFTLRAGPRFSDGSVNPEVSATIRRKLKAGEVSLVSSRSQTTVIGEAATVTTDSVALVAKYKFLPFLELSASPSFFRTKLASSEAKVSRVKVDATFEVTKWLSLVGSYEFSFQKGSLDRARPRDEISQNLILLRLVATNRFRLY